MTTEREWLALGELCEKAMGPDREIDRLIVVALDPRFDGYPSRLMPKMRCTASLDTIAALTEQELPGRKWLSLLADDMVFYSLIDPSCPPVNAHWKVSPSADGKAKTEPLARCAAFCRAMAEKSKEQK